MASTDRTGRTRAGTDVHDDRPPVIVSQPDYDVERRNDQRRRDAEGLRDHKHDRVDERRIKPAKTSGIAVFALVFGLSALYAVLTVLLSPGGLVLSVIGIVLGIAGIKATKRVGVTGRGVAISGLVLSVIALVGSIVLLAGVTTFLNDEDAVNRLENGVQDMRDDLPTNVELPQP